MMDSITTINSVRGLVEKQAENLPQHTFGLVDYKYLINWSLKNARLPKVC